MDYKITQESWNSSFQQAQRGPRENYCVWVEMFSSISWEAILLLVDHKSF